MNLKKLVAGLLVTGSLAVITGFTYDGGSPIQQLFKQLSKWTDNYPVEKVYLQFDKPYYAAGDDIWFKAYVTVGPKHQLTALSTVLNVELLDERDSIKQRFKLPMQSGIAWGDFALSDTLPEGNYHVRAYTTWMRNFDDAWFFDKVIRVVNSASNKVFTTSNYSYSMVNGRKQANVTINYADINKTPYAGKPVKYTVSLGADNVFRGKGVTDDKGALTFNFMVPQNNTANSGSVATTIELAKNDIIAKNVLIKATSNNVDVQFFPESGYLVNTVYTKIAFKAVGADGLGADVKGTITDDQNNTITNFSSQHLGMGIFKMRPQAERTYKANITFADGSVKTYDLPKAIDKSCVLGIDNSDANTIKLEITPSKALMEAANTDSLYLIAQQGGQVYFAAKTQLGTSNFTASVDKSRFPSGIVQFTLFSSKGEPLNERLVFVQNPDQLKLDVSTAKSTYSPREKVKVDLNAKNADDKPVIGTYSVSVTNETSVPVDEDDETTILSNILLTSDLKGYIEKPGYYFNQVNDKTQADLDVLMLTQGYRRFEWKKIINDEFPPITYQPEKSLQVSGRITTLTGKPVVHGKVTLISNKKGFFYVDTLTDEQGRFRFDKLIFGDSIRFVVQARTSKDSKNVQIQLDNIIPKYTSNGKIAPDMRVNINDGLSAYLQSSKQFYTAQMHYGIGNHSKVLKEVVITDKAQKKLPYSDNLNGAGNADQVLAGSDLEKHLLGCTDIAQCLDGWLVGVIFKNGVPYSIRSGKMNFIVDGMPMSDATEITPSDVASVEVLRTVSYLTVYGLTAGPGGAIIITTKRGPDLEAEAMSRPVPGIVTFSPTGYYKARVFYSPDYDDPKTNKEVADLRTTIYWNPNLFTGKDGNTSFQYFNAGSKGTYRMVIEGIDGEGNLGRKVYRYKVE